MLEQANSISRRSIKIIVFIDNWNKLTSISFFFINKLIRPKLVHTSRSDRGKETNTCSINRRTKCSRIIVNTKIPLTKYRIKFLSRNKEVIDKLVNFSHSRRFKLLCTSKTTNFTTYLFTRIQETGKDRQQLSSSRSKLHRLEKWKAIFRKLSHIIGIRIN